jgi:5-oxoprolinase (ATP-hydrolysing)
LLKIGNQTRPRIFDLNIEKPELLYERVIEVDERVKLFKGEPTESQIASGSVIKGVTGEWVEIEKKPNLDDVKALVQQAKDDGIESAAIVLLHSYTYPEHEKAIGKICDEVGFTQVSESAQLTPMIKVVQRGHTATVDAYLTPLIKNYIKSFASGFDDKYVVTHSPSLWLHNL